jgi:hypothetical protein
MERQNPQPLRIVVRPGSRPGALAGVLRCLRRLVPAAVLLVAPAASPEPCDGSAIVLDADEVVSGPLSMADALARARCRES